MPTQPSGENWSRRDDVALAIFLAWLPNQVGGRNLADAVSDSVARENAEQAIKLANLFLTVRAAPR